MSYSAKMQGSHLYSVYFAPRGSARIYNLGMQISQLYLSPFDRLIGVVGEAGSGKSMLVKGMFPGLELSNDDEGVNVRPLPLLNQEDTGFYTPHTYHVDIRFESAFTQMHELADAINTAIAKGKRVVVEHFDLIYPFLGRNAHLLIGVGEHIIITRPNLFGPEPEDICRIVFKSIHIRKMAHTAEDLCELFMPPEDAAKCVHDDVTHGFVLAFQREKPDIDLEALEQKVKEEIAKDISISFVDEEHIMVGDRLHPCTGPRTHVRTTGEIENFRLLKEFFYDAFNDRYLMVGLVGDELKRMEKNSRDFNRIDF